MARLEAMADHFGNPAEFSSDGTKLAFALVRPSNTHVGFGRRYLSNNDRADVWVKLPGETKPRNITNGLTDHSGWWSPLWSPDGRYLAMLSTRGGAGIGEPTPWIWDSRSERLAQLSPRALEIGAQRRSIEWVDSSSLVCMFRPAGELWGNSVTQAVRADGWNKMAAGVENTASVIDSGKAQQAVEQPQPSLVRIDIRGKALVLSEKASLDWQISPDRRYIAYAVRTQSYSPSSADLTWSHANNDVHTIEISSLEGRRVLATQTATRGLVTNALRWSRGSRAIAFLTDGDGPMSKYDVVIGDIASGKIRRIDLDSFQTNRAQGLEWWGDRAVVIRGSETKPSGAPASDARQDWWLLSDSGTRRNLTSSILQCPAQIWATHKNTFVGLAAGELWEISPGDVQPRLLTGEVEEPISGIEWPVARGATSRGRVLEQTSGQPDLVLEAQGDVQLERLRFELSSYRISALQSPGPGSDLVAYSPVGAHVLFHRTDRNGMTLWHSEGERSPPVTLLERNTFLREIAEGEFRSIAYTSIDGEALRAWLILPVGYQRGRKYPLVSWIYPGTVHSEATDKSRLWISDPNNLQIAAARGFAILLPSIPLDGSASAQDPMLRIQSGVMPAVEKIVEMGIADPDRLYVMGNSFGGFATFGLVTQTDRFAAAVALAGFVNPISLYGQFDTLARYSKSPMDYSLNPAMLEAGQVLLGGPPWRELGRYLRNSPILQVDQVNTPLMMIQGDLDFVSMSQPEEFFAGLYRQGKEARLVRYWGEDHVLTSPANVADSWERIFEWFDTHRKERTH